jgi:hypothetical protein
MKKRFWMYYQHEGMTFFMATDEVEGKITPFIIATATESGKRRAFSFSFGRTDVGYPDYEAIAKEGYKEVDRKHFDAKYSECLTWGWISKLETV